MIHLLMAARFHLEKSAKQLKLLGRVLAIFSKCALKLLDNQADFDSAIPKWPSLLACQPKVSWTVHPTL